MKKISALILSVFLCLSLIIPVRAETWREEYPWAEKSVTYCIDNGIIAGDEFGNLKLGANLTRAQMARIFTDTFNLSSVGTMRFEEVKKTDWFYKYAYAIQDYTPKKESIFDGGAYVTREEFAATLAAASGLKASDSYTVTSSSFSDASDADDAYKNLIEAAVVNLYMLGDNGKIRPKDYLTRAEACCFLYRAVMPEADKTLITGEAEVSLEQAQKWARAKNSADIFVDIASVYWKYGELTGIRPDVLYAQAAKETAYGRYGGAVLPEMNNWAGIKVKNPEGDRTEDHETFLTPENGVRAHFNHVGAYVGIEPTGEAHDRYYVVKSIAWAGTVKYVEQLGGRWCPNINYGCEILSMIDNMKTY